jgi:phosphoenolpyruvate carboxylase
VDLDDGDQRFMERLSKVSHAAYKSLREDSLFLPYLEDMTPLAFYGQLNIASRPTRRKAQSMRFEDLRAIPFVGAWSQMKQNIPGFYGVGEGFKKLSTQGQKKRLEELYAKSLFFRTLVENAMMSLLKSFFPLTRYLEKDKRFGRLWRRIFREATLSKQSLKDVTGQLKLLENSPVVRESIHMREKIVLPVLVIQQWALLQLKQSRKEGAHPAFSPEALEKMIVKSMGTIINAGRNSA